MRNKGRDMSILHKCCCGGEEIPMSLTHEIVYGGLVESNSPPQDGIHDCLQISGKFNGQKAKFGINEEILSKILKNEKVEIIPILHLFLIS